MFFLPVYSPTGRLTLPRAGRALKGWKKAMPGSTRRPLLWSVRCGIALDLALRQLGAMALCWLIMIDAYLRPSEACELRVAQVIPRQAGKGLGKTALHLNPDYMQRLSKTGELDESVLINRDWLGQLLESYAKQRPQEGRLWPFLLPELRKEFMQSAEKAGVKFLHPVLYMGRHSGASLDRLEGRLSLAEVMKRGRWRATSSVARYEKRALVQEVLHRMRTGDKAYCLRAEAAIGGVLRRSFARG